MKKLAAVLITVSALTSGCAAYGTPDRVSDRDQSKPHQPVDQNRNGVPDPLERKAVPMEPVIVRPTGPAG